MMLSSSASSIKTTLVDGSRRLSDVSRSFVLSSRKTRAAPRAAVFILSLRDKFEAGAHTISSLMLEMFAPFVAHQGSAHALGAFSQYSSVTRNGDAS